MRNLRLLVREIIKEIYHYQEGTDVEDEDLLTEPDDVEFSVVSGTGQELEKEASAVGAIAGVTTPLGTGPTYPAATKRKRKKKLPAGWQKSK